MGLKQVFKVSYPFQWYKAQSTDLYQEISPIGLVLSLYTSRFLRKEWCHIYACCPMPAPADQISFHNIQISSASFHNACPYRHSLFCCSTEIMSSNTPKVLKHWRELRALIPTGKIAAASWILFKYLSFIDYCLMFMTVILCAFLVVCSCLPSHWFMYETCLLSATCFLQANRSGLFPPCVCFVCKYW